MAQFHHNHHTTQMESRRRFKYSANPSSNLTLPDKRKQTPKNRIPKKRHTPAAAVTVAKNLGVGQVKILKRGETLGEWSTNLKKAENDRKMLSSSYAKTEASKTEDGNVYSSRRFGSDPDMGSKQNVTECFAGFVFFDSPPPSSVPLPGFSRKNLVSNVKNDACSKL